MDALQSSKRSRRKKGLLPTSVLHDSRLGDHPVALPGPQKGAARPPLALAHALAKKMKDAQLSETGDFFQTTTPDFLSDAYTVFDLFGSYNVSDHLRVSAGVYNLFDERYYLWSRIRLVNEGTNTLYGYVTGEGIGRYSEPGRNLRLTVSYRF